METVTRYENKATELAGQLVDGGIEASHLELHHVARILSARGDTDLVSYWQGDSQVSQLVTALTTGLGWTTIAAQVPARSVPRDPDQCAALACLHMNGGECSPRQVRQLASHDCNLPTLQRDALADGWIRLRHGADPRGGVVSRWVLPLCFAGTAAAAASKVEMGKAEATIPDLPLTGSTLNLRHTVLALAESDETSPNELIAAILSAAAYGDAYSLRSLLRTKIKEKKVPHRQDLLRSASDFLSWTLGKPPNEGISQDSDAQDSLPSLLSEAVTLLLSTPETSTERIARIHQIGEAVTTQEDANLQTWVAQEIALSMVAQGSLDEARTHCNTARWFAQTFEEPYLEARCELVEAMIRAKQGIDREVEEHLEAAMAILAGVGTRCLANTLLMTLAHPRLGIDRQSCSALVNGWVASHRSISEWEWAMLPHTVQLSHETQRRLWERGASGKLADLITSPLIRAPFVPPRITQLTPRESQVSILVSKGLTNDQIARRLGLSRWTVVNHLRKVMRKLDCLTRVQVATHVSHLSLAER